MEAGMGGDIAGRKSAPRPAVRLRYEPRHPGRSRAGDFTKTRAHPALIALGEGRSGDAARRGDTPMRRARSLR